MGYYSGTIQHGSSGEDVKKWQEFLNSQGYNLTVDGIFGDNTLTATREWQGNNGLGVDGIVGQNTWGKAGFSNLHTPVSAPSEATYTPFGETDEGRTLSENKTNAYKALTGYGDPNWAKSEEANTLLDSILKRPKFSYDFNADALYQQYKDKYIQQGKMAMADAMGQASTMTGGYGNSYAASVGNQAYQAHLNNLNDIIPDLYNMALSKYSQEGEEMRGQYGMLMQDYDKYMSEYNAKYGRLKDAYDIADDAYFDTATLYGNEQDSRSENAWKKAEWDESARRYAEEKALAQAQAEAEAQAKLEASKPKSAAKIKTRYGTGKEYKATPKQSVATNTFVSNHETLSEWTRHGKSTSSYYEYIKGEIKKIEGNLSDEELLYLINKYGLS